MLDIVIGLTVWIIILAAVVGASRRGGPALALRRFGVYPSGPVAVHIEGRPAGLMGWFLTIVGLDTLTTLQVTDRQILFRRASLSGEVHHIVPSVEICSTHCGYHQPIWLLLLGGVALLAGLLGALVEPSAAAGALLGGVLFSVLCVVLYYLNRKITVSIETTGGMVLGLSFKPSVIENVSVDLPRALAVVARVNEIVLAQKRGGIV